MDNNLFQISFEEYKKIEAISRSDLLNLERGAKYFVYRKDFAQQNESESLRFGRLVHKAILEPEDFKKDYFIVEKTIRKGKAWEEIKQDANGREIIFFEDFEKIEKIKTALFSNKVLVDKKLLDNTVNEVTARWLFADLGIKPIMCKCRFDAIKMTDKSNILIDIKTTGDCSEEAFSSDMARYKYHLQAAFYIDGFEAATNKKVNRFLFIVIEKEPPFLNKIYSIMPNSDEIIVGRKEYKILLNKYNDLLSNGFYETDVTVPIRLPTWYKFKNK